MLYLVAMFYVLCFIPMIRSDHINTADKLIEDLRRAVEIQLVIALPMLEDHYDNIKTTSSLVTGRAEIDEAKEVSDVRLQIEALIAEAETLGTIDMKLLETCIDSYDGHLDLVHDFVLLSIRLCAQTTELKALNFINETKSTFEGVLNEIDLLQSKVEECKTDEEVNNCILKVIPMLTNAISTLPPMVEEESDKAEEVIIDLESTLSLCLSDRKGVITLNGQEVLKNIKTCAEMPVS